jgi:hypothetical protein
MAALQFLHLDARLTHNDMRPEHLGLGSVMVGGVSKVIASFIDMSCARLHGQGEQMQPYSGEPHSHALTAVIVMSVVLCHMPLMDYQTM